MRDRKTDQHRRLTEAELGRKLGPDEVVHHRNEDKDDNSKTNREVQTRAVHSRDHAQNRSLSKLRQALRVIRSGGKKVY